MKISDYPRRPDWDELPETGQAAIRDMAGNLWRLSEPQPGQLTLMLADTPAAGTALLIEPQANNAIRITAKG